MGEEEEGCAKNGSFPFAASHSSNTTNSAIPAGGVALTHNQWGMLPYIMGWGGECMDHIRSSFKGNFLGLLRLLAAY